MSLFGLRHRFVTCLLSVINVGKDAIFTKALIILLCSYNFEKNIEMGDKIIFFFADNLFLQLEGKKSREHLILSYLESRRKTTLLEWVMGTALLCWVWKLHSATEWGAGTCGELIYKDEKDLKFYDYFIFTFYISSVSSINEGKWEWQFAQWWLMVTTQF